MCVLRCLLLVLLGVFAFGTAAQAEDIRVLGAPRGEQVWYVSDHALPMIAVNVSLPAGSAYDPHGKDGLAYFAANLLDEGAGGLNATAFQTALGNRAIRLTVSPGRDYLTISLVTLADNAKDAFQLLGLALSRPRFDADAVARVRAQILSSLAEEKGDPAAVAENGFYRAYFRDQPYGHAVDGDPATIAAITQADLKAFALQHWVRGDLKIAVSGDVDAATLSVLLNSAFGKLPPKTPPPPPWPTHVGQPGVQFISVPVPQSSIVLGLPGLLRKDREFIPAFIANYIIGGGGFASRLTNALREKRGLTYDVDTSLETLRRAGVMTGMFATKRESVRQSIEVVRATLAEFSQNGPTEAELADAKTYLTGSFPLSFSSNVETVAALNGFQQVGLPFDYVGKRNSLIEAVTLADVRKAARRLYDPRTLTVVVAGIAAGAGQAVPGGNPAGISRH